MVNRILEVLNLPFKGGGRGGQVSTAKHSLEGSTVSSCFTELHKT